MLLSDITTFEADTQESYNALESLGLRQEWLTEVCIRALAAFNQATQFDAANAAGSYAYFAAVRAIREILCPQGWQMLRLKNLEITKNPIDKTTIIVSSGDEHTGIRDKVPSSKNRKGRQTQLVIDTNQMQLTFWEDSTVEKQIEDELGPTWILLYHIDLKKFQLRLELSLPIEMDIDELRVNGWNQRIILPPIDFNDQFSVPSRNFNQDGESEYDFEPEIKISRRNDNDE